MVVNEQNVNKKYLQAILCILHIKVNECKAYVYELNRRPEIQIFI
nr:MAG TPA: hypothetical protein [Crassvirales sp.]